MWRDGIRFDARTRAVLGGIFCAGSLIGTAEGAPITFNTALPVSKGHFVGRQLAIYEKADGAAGEARAIQSVSVLGFGATPRLAVFAIAPVVFKEFEPIAGPDREASGLSDIRVFARYTLLQSDARGGAFRLSPFAGVDLPTGESRKSDAQGALPRALQPGSGSLDYFAGLIATYATLDWSLDGQVSWQVNRRDGAFNAGDTFTADISFYRRLLPGTLQADTKGFLSGGVEVNFADERRSHFSGVIDPRSGGARLFISPGLQYARKNWIAEAVVQIPAWNDADRAGLRPDVVVRTGLRVNF
jgi:hypothetical protein